MNYEASRFWLEVTLFAWNIAGSGYLIWERYKRRNDTRIDEVKKEVAGKLDSHQLAIVKADRDKLCEEHKRRTSALEQGLRDQRDEHEKQYRRLHQEIAHLPSRNEIQEHAKTMREMTEEMGILKGRLSGLNRAVDIVNQFLIQQGGKQ